MDKKNVPNYLEYIFDTIIVAENFILENTNIELLEFIEKVEKYTANAVPCNMFNKTDLLLYDTTIRLLANLIFELIPDDEGIILNDTPSLKQFKGWLGSLGMVDLSVLLFFLIRRGYLIVEDDKKFEFIINVIYTVRVV
jgi:hypothetical protein